MDRTFWVGLAKDWGIALVAVLVGFALWNGLFVPDPIDAGSAPAFDLPDPAGGRATLAEHADEVLVLNFWFTSCPPCRAEIPEISAFARAHPDIPVLGISVDRGMDLDRLGVAAQRLGITYPIAHDAQSTVAEAYGVSMFPTTFVIDHGTIRQVAVGGVDQRRLEAMVGP